MIIEELRLEAFLLERKAIVLIKKAHDRSKLDLLDRVKL